MTPTREELMLAVNEADWHGLRAHLERGGLILVAGDLDIVDVGLSVANDDAAAVGGWIEAQKLNKPTAEQIAAWAGFREKLFYCLIVSPYVLIQEKPEVFQ
jgi:hypothetical protein